MFYGSVSTGSRLLWEWLTNLDFNKKLQLQKTENQLQLLKSNIKIPFVIDVLDDLQTKAKSNPALVQNEIIELSNVMRYNLYHVKKDLVQLKEELEILDQLVLLIKKVYDHQIIYTQHKTETINSGILIKIVFEYYWIVKSSFKFKIEKGALKLPLIHEKLTFEGEIQNDQILFKLTK